MPRGLWLAILFASPFGFGFQPQTPQQLAPPQTTPTTPEPTFRPDPQYSADARAAHIQGTVLVELYVDTDGKTSGVSVLRPIGFGLDEAAIAAVSQWRFIPAMRDGHAVKTFAQVEVTFRLQRNDANDDRRAHLYNLVLSALKQGKPDEKRIATLRSLVSERYPPAIYLYGLVLEEGLGVPADPQKGRRLIEEAAAKRFGPALYEVAMARLKAGGQPQGQDKNPAKNMDAMRTAARLGSQEAQRYLGQAYEKGEGVPVDLEKSRQNFRLCAAAGNAVCQFRLGKSLLEDARHDDHDRVEAAAYLQLASAAGNADAPKALAAAQLTPSQLSDAKKLEGQLVNKP